MSLRLVVTEHYIPETDADTDDHTGSKTVTWLVMAVKQIANANYQCQGQNDFCQGSD